jgi:hypothetical protein
MAEEQSVSIGIVNPEAVMIEDDDGSVVIDFAPSSEPSWCEDGRAHHAVRGRYRRLPPNPF